MLCVLAVCTKRAIASSSFAVAGGLSTMDMALAVWLFLMMAAQPSRAQRAFCFAAAWSSCPAICTVCTWLYLCSNIGMTGLNS